MIKSSYIYFVGALVITGLFIGYHAGLEQYYRLSADDFSGIDYASKGFPGISYAWRFYLNWEGPFLSLLIQGLLMYLVSLGVQSWLVLLLVKFAFFLSSAVLLRAVSDRFNMGWSWSRVAFASSILATVLYIISPNRPEIWHWLIGSVYILPLIFLQLGASALIRNRILLAAVPLAFIMQSRATYAVLIFGLMFILTIVNWWRNDPKRNQWVILTALLAIFLFVYLVAPGNYVRMTPHGNSFAFLVSQFRMGLHNLFLSFNLANLDRIFLGLLAVLTVLGGSGQVLKPKRMITWFLPLALYLGFSVFHEAIFVFVTGYTEWTRVLSLHSFLFLSMCTVYAFWLYYSVAEWIQKIIRPIGAVALIMLMAWLFTGYRKELKTARSFAENYDQRMSFILAHSGHSGDTLYIDPIDYEGTLYFKDFSKDPDNWINSDFKKAYGLDFKIAIK